MDLTWQLRAQASSPQQDLLSVAQIATKRLGGRNTQSAIISMGLSSPCAGTGTESLHWHQMAAIIFLICLSVHLSTYHLYHLFYTHLLNLIFSIQLPIHPLIINMNYAYNHLLSPFRWSHSNFEEQCCFVPVKMSWVYYKTVKWLRINKEESRDFTILRTQK